MTFSVKMPALGESVTEGTVTRWLKAEGDHVALDEPLLEVSTDKVDTEIPSPAAGVLQKILVAVDSVAPVGAELALIADGASAPATPAAPVAAAPVTPAPVTPPTPTPASVQSAPVQSTPAPQQSGSATAVVMPALGESVTEGTVTRWLKNVGDSVNVDEALLEVSTDKVDTEIPSPASGVLLSIDVPVDSTVAVGTKLASIGASGSAPASVPTPPKVAPTPAPAAPQPVVAQAPTPPQPVAPAPVAPSTKSSVLDDSYVTPIVRKLAAENGVDLSRVKGTGVGGRIRKEDVLAAVPRVSAPAVTATSTPVAAASTPKSAAPIQVSPLRGTTVTMSRLRKVIAARMLESLQVSAQLTTVIEVDITKIARLREKAKGSFETREGVKLTFLPFFAVAVCEALKQHPVVNASVEGDQITYHGAEHLGIAVDTDRGLLVPVIRDAGDLNMGGIARRIVDVASRTRDNKISPDDLGGGTFTITNTGSRGALFDTPIINQPQVAILGVGAVVKRPMVVKGEDGGETIAIRSMVYLALSYDHRIVDGADAARFLSTLKERLEEGRFESDLGL
ncbi:MAG: 2-oxoglutarate dehydrogenase, E2 component, dihydrolipoamide succinyltransferase [Actinobacteria bacterium]|jgi:2-oxoglutarate dehydrogenase E2 component (dihydrolipoamide succinyltransferase)|nr:2-oxoglutarate dehydrogenase, E2 component, dihydrolipoamide succinyltransferase [Actinomycetota bacterium]NCU89435.1 2-oxoglutarate dehydrogenase, E2 component, dihydrolipoamide succinyltransferase [Actinomycetota bacterium]NDE54123.1 2-oxoglutarate dehydrogenase, E2 component, dihydrolipoamide succinyltransferase [Actinomycetota bacterium]